MLQIWELVECIWFIILMVRLLFFFKLWLWKRFVLSYRIPHVILVGVSILGVLTLNSSEGIIFFFWLQARELLFNEAGTYSSSMSFGLCAIRCWGSTAFKYLVFLSNLRFLKIKNFRYFMIFWKFFEIFRYFEFCFINFLI